MISILFRKREKEKKRLVLMDEKGTPHTRDNTMPVDGDEYREGLLISVAVGFYYTFNAYLPILAWYSQRSDKVTAMSNNSIYKYAWQLIR